jgi:GNAT superfamily N-acetyltransferase
VEKSDRRMEEDPTPDQIYTCEIDPGSPKFMEAFTVLNTWMHKKFAIQTEISMPAIPADIPINKRGIACIRRLCAGLVTRNVIELREYPPAAGMYQGILSDILKSINRLSGTRMLKDSERHLKEYTHLFGAWDDHGQLHGLATVLTFGRHIPCPWKDGSTLLIDSLCVGPGRFVDDELTPPKGVGASLLKHIVHWAVKRGFKTIVLDTTLQAKDFYIKYGFEARAWPFTKAHGWMELRNSEGQWSRILSCEKYSHTMIRCDRVPTMTLYEWILLYKEVSPKFEGLVKAMSHTEHKDDPFIIRISQLPAF